MKKQTIVQPKKGKGRNKYFIIAKSKKTGSVKLYDWFTNKVAEGLVSLSIMSDFNKANKYLSAIDIRNAPEGMSKREAIYILNAFSSI